MTLYIGDIAARAYNGYEIMMVEKYYASKELTV